MSLVLYDDSSNVPFDSRTAIILHDPDSRSLVLLNQVSGEISLVQQIKGPTYVPDKPIGTISTYICPQCGSEVGGISTTGSVFNISSPIHDENDLYVDKNYFKLLGQEPFFRRPPHIADYPTTSSYSSIPPELFAQDYYHRFFEELSLLGNGARGSVYKVAHVLMNNNLGVYALKKIPIGNDLNWLEKCIQEVKFLSSLTHNSANLITYNHVWLEMDTSCGIVKNRQGEGSSQDDKVPCIFILQQFCPGGNLEDCILSKVFNKFQDHDSPEERKRRFKLKRKSKNKDLPLGLTTDQILSILYDISSGLQELHDLGIIHRDLKPSNCLLLEKYSSDTVPPTGKPFPTVIIGDFGESQVSGQLRSATGATGTLEFTAPEVLIMSPDTESSLVYPQFTFQSDIYSLGMICYFLVFGELPFSPEKSIGQLKADIRGFQFNKAQLLEKHQHMNLHPISEEIFDLMELLLSPCETERPSAKEVRKILSEIEGKQEHQYELSDPEQSEPAEEISFQDDVAKPKVAQRNATYYSLHFKLKQNAWNLLNLIISFYLVSRKQDHKICQYLSIFALGVSLRSSLAVQKISTFLNLILICLVSFVNKHLQ